MLFSSANSLQELLHEGPLPRELPFSRVETEEVELEVIGLFEEFRHPLLRYAISLGLPVHDAEEAIQEVFLALFRHLRAGKSRRNLRGWIFRVAHNLALKQRTANRKRAQQHDDDGAEMQADIGPNPEESAASNQQQQRLQAVLRALPEQDRCCLCLRAEGLRYREIAATLGISLGAVSIALARSLKRMERAGGAMR
jgi:RNA polymerase sigma-70 factor, ECF subfamily